MRGRHVGCAETVPRRIVPEVGQSTEHFAKVPASLTGSEPSDVLQEDEARSNVSNDPSILSPERRPLPAESGAESRDADVLAVVDDETSGDVAVVVGDLEVVDACPLSERANRSNWNPAVSIFAESFVMVRCDVNGVLSLLPHGAALDDRGGGHLLAMQPNGRARHNAPDASHPNGQVAADSRER